jgi:hypothetical protein
MNERKNSSRSGDEMVGEERPVDVPPARGVTGWFTMGTLTFAIVIVVAIVFVVAIIVAAR